MGIKVVIIHAVAQFVPAFVIVVFFAIPFAIRLRVHFKKVRRPQQEVTAMKWTAYHHWMFGKMWLTLYI